MSKIFQQSLSFVFLSVFVCLGWVVSPGSAKEESRLPRLDDTEWKFYKYTSRFSSVGGPKIWAICDPRHGNLIYVVRGSGNSLLSKGGCPKEPMD